MRRVFSALFGCALTKYVVSTLFLKGFMQKGGVLWAFKLLALSFLSAALFCIVFFLAKRFLPKHILRRGLLFGAGVWAAGALPTLCFLLSFVSFSPILPLFNEAVAALLMGIIASFCLGE